MTQTYLSNWERETTTEDVFCDECDEAIDGTPLVVVRERDDEVLALCSSHVTMEELAAGFTIAEYDEGEG